MGRRKMRLRRLAGRLLFVAGVLALAAAMVKAVGRGSEVRRITEEISRLEQRSEAAGNRVNAAMRRVDSLTSRSRLLREARRLGLRPASDEEITFLRDEPRARPDGR